MRLRKWVCATFAGSLLACAGGSARGGAPAQRPLPDGPAAVERGRRALTETGYLRPAWDEAAYRAAGRLWGASAPGPETPSEDYAAAFNRRYGLHPAPYPNDGLPMGLRRGNGPEGTKVGVQIDCLICHGGSIGGVSYVGLGNTQIDLKALLNDMTRADGTTPPPSTFVLNTTRGTVNAGMVAAVLLSLRNSDLSVRRFPVPLGANLPEMDTPPWWRLGRKLTMYYDGRTDARSARSTMQFLLGEKTLPQLQALEPTFLDILAYLRSLKPPNYPFPIDPDRGDRGRAVFERHCVECHGTYGPDGDYPNTIVPLKTIGTDPARALGLSDRLVAHYNATWLGASLPVNPTLVGYQAPPLDGIWATAPFLHNGSVPTLATLLKSSNRPRRFTRPPSTAFEHYDPEHVGWKFTVPTPATPPADPKFLFDSTRFGLGNGGHTFGDKLSDAERNDLIEYLKTL